MRTNVYSIWLLVVALIAGAWSIPSARNSAIEQSELDANSSCDHASTELVGRSADLPNIKGLIHDICDFHVKLDQVPRNVSDFDKAFVEDSITSNTLELQSLKIALASSANEEWHGQIQMMIDMHTSDLQMAIALARKIGADTKPDLTHASVYPETPDYDLGKRFENLTEEYLDPLKNAAGGVIGTPTPVPTDTPTGVATETPTTVGIPTDTPTVVPFGTATMVPTDTPTGILTDTPTAIAADTATGVPTDTPTIVPTETATGLPMDTPTAVSTGTPGGGGTATSFDIVSLNIIEDEHVADVQAELAAERLVRNDELRAFAKHSADVTELHLLLMGDLKHRLVDNYTPPSPEFQADYQNPRKLQP